MALDAGSRRDEEPDDNVLLEADEAVDISPHRSRGKYLRRLLEGGRGEEAVCRKGRLGDAVYHRTPLRLFTKPADERYSLEQLLVFGGGGLRTQRYAACRRRRDLIEYGARDLLRRLDNYAAVLVMVHLTAKRDGLRGLPPEELPEKRSVLKRAYMMSPIILLVYLLLDGYTPMYAAIAGIVLAWGVSLPNPKRRMGPKGILRAIHDGAKGIPVVCTACASAGFVLGAVALSGIGPKIVSAVLSVSHGIPVLTLLLIAVVCLILGMGLPTTSAYILAASLSVPALGQLHFNSIAAHMFVFYYAIISNITPPVALAAYAAASIAEDSPNKTGWAACRLGFLAFVILFAFCYDGGLLLQLDWTHNVISIVSGVALVFGIGFSFTGYCGGRIPMWSRVLFAAFGLASMWKSSLVSLGGTTAIFVLYIFCQKVFADKKASSAI